MDEKKAVKDTKISKKTERKGREPWREAGMRVAWKR